MSQVHPAPTPCAPTRTHARLLAAVLALGGAGTVALPAGAADRSAGENIIYAWAQVLRADPVYERVLVTEQVEQCSDSVEYERIDGGGRRTAGAVIGAVVGGVLGNQVGDGSGRRAATAAGAVAGGVAGSRIAGDGGTGEVVLGPGCQLVEVDREVNQLAGYDVEYRYRGDVFMSRVAEDPGERMRIRIAVSPAIESGPR
jgi:uncharacterized protein YcfJ